jgi:anti-anti-sigma factor
VRPPPSLYAYHVSHLFRKRVTLIVRLNGHFDSCAQPALHEAFNWIAGPVTIDLRNNTSLGAAALAELVMLARRLGDQRVTVVNPSPLMRRLIAATRLDRVLHVSPCDETLRLAPMTYIARLHRAAPGPQALTQTDRAARLEFQAAW